jgi:Siphovirus Gp157
MSTAPVIAIDTKTSLFEIRDTISAYIESIEGLEDPELRAQAEAELDLYLQCEVKKVDRICDYLSHCESQQQHAAAEIKRLQDRKRAAERCQERVEASVLRVMELWGLKKLEGRTSSLAMRQCPPSVEVLDIAVVPPGYIRTTVTEAVDKQAAKVHMAGGQTIPGLCLSVRTKVVRK